MKVRAALVVLVGALLALAARGPAAEEGLLRQFPGTRVKLRIPETFVQREWMPALVSESLGAMISCAEGIAADSKDFLRFVEEETLRGQDILERKELQISSHPARLLRFQTRPAQTGQTNWKLIGCEKARFFQVTVAVKGTGEDAIGKTLQEMLNGAQWDLATPADVGSLVDAQIVVPEGLFAIATILAREMHGSGVEFTSGLLESGMRDPAAVHWTVQCCATKTKPNQLEAECRSRLWENPGADKAEETVSHAVEVNGCAGWEIEAREKRGFGKPPKHWHEFVILRTPESLLQFQGSVSIPESDKWLPKFRDAARNWKPRASSAASDLPKK